MVPKDRRFNNRLKDIIEKRTFVPTADKHNGAVVYKRKMMTFSPPEFGIRKIHFNWLYKSGDGIWVLAEHKPKPELLPPPDPSPPSDLEYYPEIELPRSGNCPVNQKGIIRLFGEHGKTKMTNNEQMKCTTSVTKIN